MTGHTAESLADWKGYLTQREVAFLKELAMVLPDNPVIINIGAGAGTSTLSFLEARRDCVVFSIDVRTNENPEITGEHLRLAEIEPTDAARVIRIWGDSKVVGRSFPWVVDMVFVDGEHGEDGIKGDILTWLPKVEGIMAFHDYGQKLWPAIQPIVDQMMVNKQVIDQRDTTIAFWVGLGQ